MKPWFEDKRDCAWMVAIIERNVQSAKWVKLIKAGTTTATVRVRYPYRSSSDKEVEDREAYLSAIHPSVWEVRIHNADRDGESYDVIFTRPRQYTLDDYLSNPDTCVMCGKSGGVIRADRKPYCSHCWTVWNS